jgi:hypothetical protein
MNKNVKMKLAMYESVLATLKEKESLLNSSPALSNAVNKLEAEINVFKGVAYLQSDTHTWVTAHKQLLIDELMKKAFITKKIVVAYAVSNELPDLENRFNWKTSEFIQGGTQGKLARISSLLAILPDHLAGLTPYGIGQTEIDELVNLFTAVEEYMNVPRLSKTNRSTMTQELKLKMRKVDRFLSIELDAIMLLLSTIDLEAYTHYKASRKLVNMGVRHRKPNAESADQDVGPID